MTREEPPAAAVTATQKYPHVPPRIDPEWYQAEIPYAQEGPMSTDAVMSDWFDSTRNVHSTEDSKDVKKNFLRHTRNIFERRKLGVSRRSSEDPPLVWKKEQSSFPLESDEAVLEFLSRHGNDINKAKFFMACLMSGGRDTIHARRMRQQLAKLPNIPLSQRLNVVFSDHNGVWMYGAYANRSDSGGYISDATDGGILFLPDFGSGNGTPSALNSNNRPKSLLHSDIESSVNIHKYEVDVFASKDDEISKSSGKSSSEARDNKECNGSSGACIDEVDEMESDSLCQSFDKPQRDRALVDKSAMRKKWNSIAKTASTLVSSLKSSYGGVSRASLDSVHELLTTAFASTPVPSDIVLGSELLVQLEENFHTIVDSYVMCREWVGDVYDALCPLALVSNKYTSCDFKRLKELYSEGEGLPFRCSFEENQLKKILKEIEDLVAKGQDVIRAVTDNVSMQILEIIDGYDKSNEDEPSSAVAGERKRNRGKSGGKSNRKSAASSQTDADYIVDKLLGTDVDSLQGDKICIFELSTLLDSFSKFPLHMANLPDNFTCHWQGERPPRSSNTSTYPVAVVDDRNWKSHFRVAHVDEGSQEVNKKDGTAVCDVGKLAMLYKRALDLNENIENILNVAGMQRHKKHFSKTQPTLSSLIDVFIECSSYPVQLFGLSSIQSLVKSGVEWHRTVKTSCRPNAPVLSLNRVEALISQGEKLPIDFTAELETLREKRGAAKQWLDKFKKSINISTSRPSRDNQNADVNKMCLNDMKKLIEEGGQLYEDRKNKELGKAMNVVDDAEDLIGKVKDIVAGGGVTSDESGMESCQNIDVLKDLLHETESMPVAMEEVQLLRAHIDTIEWAKKARPILRLDQPSDESGKFSRYRASSMSKLQKDLLKTRDGMSAEMKKQFQAIKVRLPEEEKLQKVLSLIEKFQRKVRKRFTSSASSMDDMISRNATIRTSITLSALRQMRADIYNINELVNIDFDSELVQLNAYINSAEEWLREHSDTLAKLSIPLVSLSPFYEESAKDHDSDSDADDDDKDGGEQSNVVPSLHKEVSAGEPTPLKSSTLAEALNSIDSVNEDNLVSYNLLSDIVKNSFQNVDISFPELTAVKTRLKNVDEWLEDLNSFKPQGVDNMSNDQFLPSRQELIDSSDLTGFISEGLELRVDLHLEMRQIRDWIRSSEEWEACNKPIYESIVTKVHDEVDKFRSALLNGDENNDVMMAPAGGFRVPFLEGLDNSVAEFESEFSLSGADLEACLKPPRADEFDGLVLAFKSIVELYRSIKGEVEHLLKLRRRDIGFIVARSSVSSTSESSQPNLGIIFETIIRLLTWFDRVARLIVANSSDGQKDVLWADISYDVIHEAVDDIRKIMSVDELLSTNNSYYDNTLLYSSTPSSYFHTNAALAEGGNGNAPGDSDSMEVADCQERYGDEVKHDTSPVAQTKEKQLPGNRQESHKTRQSTKRPRSGKDKSEKLVTRRSNKKQCRASGAEPPPTSPVAAAVHCFYNSYDNPSYKAVDILFDTDMPSNPLSIEEISKKKEASLYAAVADRIMKDQLSQKSYRGAKFASGETADPYFNPLWQSVSFSQHLECKVHNLLVWGFKRNIACRTRRVLEFRFGRSQLWCQVAQMYLSRQLTGCRIETTSSNYVIDQFHFPLEPPKSYVMPVENSTMLGWDVFVQLRAPQYAAFQDLNCEAKNVDHDCGGESSSRKDYSHLLNSVIPKLSLEEMKMFISAAESGGGLVENEGDRDEDEDCATKSEENVKTLSPLQYLKELVVLSQPLLINQPEILSDLKENLAQCKDWIKRFHRIQEVNQLQAAGASADNILPSSSSDKQPEKEESGLVNVNNECEILIQEANQGGLKGTGIDLSEYLDQITQVTQVYCLCRLPFHGLMVGCDQCNDWLHGACVGLSKVQAEKTDKYTCIRCNIQKSATQGLQNIANIVASWMDPEDAVKHLETKRYRVTKKVTKEECDLAVLRRELSSTQVLLSNVEMQLSANEDQMLELKAKEKKLEGDIPTAESRLEKAQRDEKELKKFYSLSIESRLAWNRWMIMVRDVIWRRGSSTSSADDSIIPFKKDVLIITERARELGIIDFPDISNILNSFRWVSFCYLATWLLRGPSTKRQMEALLQIPKKLRIGYMDDKLVRSVNGILNRTRAWKAKVKKLISSSSSSLLPSGRKSSQGQSIADKVVLLDEGKTKTLLEEGTSCLPMRTRLRDQLREALYNHEKNGGEDRSKGSNRRGSQKAAVKDTPADNSKKSSSQVRLVLEAVVSKSGNVGYYSSDEDESDDEEDESDAPYTLSDIDKAVYGFKFPSQRKLSPIPTHQLAPPVSQAMPFPPLLKPAAAPEYKPYSSSYRHIKLGELQSRARVSYTRPASKIMYPDSSGISTPQGVPEYRATEPSYSNDEASAQSSSSPSRCDSPTSSIAPFAHLVAKMTSSEGSSSSAPLEDKTQPKKEKKAKASGVEKEKKPRANKKSNQRADILADEKARALLESITSGADSHSQVMELDEESLSFVPKTVADALKMGANFVEKKRQQGVEALKNTIGASLTAKKRKQHEAMEATDLVCDKDEDVVEEAESEHLNKKEEESEPSTKKSRCDYDEEHSDAEDQEC